MKPFVFCLANVADVRPDQWRRQDFVTGGGEVRYGSIGGLEYEVPPTFTAVHREFVGFGTV